MGMSLKSGDGDDDLGEVSEINVTPFIDVVLVLLIIFMVAAPLSTVDVAVDLPSSNAPPAERQGEPVYLTLKRDLSLALGEETVPSEALAAALDRQTGGNREERVYLRADEAVAYGELMETMNALRTAGYLKIALVGLEAVPQGGTPTPGGAAAAAPASGAAPAP